MSNVSGKGRVKMLWRAGLRNMEPGNLKRIKPRVQDEGKVMGMRKEISSAEKEIYCGRVR